VKEIVKFDKELGADGAKAEGPVLYRLEMLKHRFQSATHLQKSLSQQRLLLIKQSTS